MQIVFIIVANLANGRVTDQRTQLTNQFGVGTWPAYPCGPVFLVHRAHSYLAGCIANLDGQDFNGRVYPIQPGCFGIYCNLLGMQGDDI